MPARTSRRFNGNRVNTSNNNSYANANRESQRNRMNENSNNHYRSQGNRTNNNGGNGNRAYNNSTGNNNQFRPHWEFKLYLDGVRNYFFYLTNHCSPEDYDKSIQELQAIMKSTFEYKKNNKNCGRKPDENVINKFNELSQDNEEFITIAQNTFTADPWIILYHEIVYSAVDLIHDDKGNSNQPWIEKLGWALYNRLMAINACEISKNIDRTKTYEENFKGEMVVDLESTAYVARRNELKGKANEYHRNTVNIALGDPVLIESLNMYTNQDRESYFRFAMPMAQLLLSTIGNHIDFSMPGFNGMAQLITMYREFPDENYLRALHTVRSNVFQDTYGLAFCIAFSDLIEISYDYKLDHKKLKYITKFNDILLKYLFPRQIDIKNLEKIWPSRIMLMRNRISIKATEEQINMIMKMLSTYQVEILENALIGILKSLNDDDVFLSAYHLLAETLPNEEQHENMRNILLTQNFGKNNMLRMRKFALAYIVGILNNNDLRMKLSSDELVETLYIIMQNSTQDEWKVAYTEFQDFIENHNTEHHDDGLTYLNTYIRDIKNNKP